MSRLTHNKELNCFESSRILAKVKREWKRSVKSNTVAFNTQRDSVITELISNTNPMNGTVDVRFKPLLN